MCLPHSQSTLCVPAASGRHRPIMFQVHVITGLAQGLPSAKTSWHQFLLPCILPAFSRTVFYTYASNQLAEAVYIYNAINAHSTLQSFINKKSPSPPQGLYNLTVQSYSPPSPPHTHTEEATLRRRVLHHPGKDQEGLERKGKICLWVSLDLCQTCASPRRERQCAGHNWRGEHQTHLMLSATENALILIPSNIILREAKLIPKLFPKLIPNMTQWILQASRTGCTMEFPSMFCFI